MQKYVQREIKYVYSIVTHQSGRLSGDKSSQSGYSDTFHCSEVGPSLSVLTVGDREELQAAPPYATDHRGGRL